MGANPDEVASATSHKRQPSLHFSLASTLDAYEVREISHHECARLLRASHDGVRPSEDLGRVGVGSD